jgi:hypothetical protein
MQDDIKEFKDRHALLLTELRRISEDPNDESNASRRKELSGILRVVARSFLRENVDPRVTEDQLAAWLTRLEAA